MIHVWPSPKMQRPKTHRRISLISRMHYKFSTGSTYVIRQRSSPERTRASVRRYFSLRNAFLISFEKGFEIARSLAKHGCRVILACRNVSKGEAACAKIRKEKVRNRDFLQPVERSILAGGRRCFVSAVGFVFIT